MLQLTPLSTQTIYTGIETISSLEELFYKQTNYIKRIYVYGLLKGDS